MPMEIIRPDTHIDFIGKWKLAVGISVAVIVISLLAIPVRGIRLGLDFAGGHEIQVKFTEKLPADEGVVRTIVSGLGVSDPTVVRFGEADDAEFLISFRGEEGQQGKVADEVRAALEKAVGPVSLDRVGFVGPKVGAELQSAGLKAVGISCLLILIYIGFRFSPRFAPGAVVALVHLLGRRAQRQAEHLMAKADAEYGLAGCDELLDLRHGIRTRRRRVSGAVRQEDAVGIACQHLIGLRGGRHHRHLAAG